MSKNLVIVESPAKAKTIEGFLGKDFKVTSSYGHVRDLPKGNNAIDVANGFVPKYEVTSDKKDVVRELKKLAKKSEMVYLASDDDREGEAISWHLKQALDLDDAHARRIVFREITKKAVQNALANPRDIDENLVNAQQARRILDRLVGFEISPILWKKIKTGLSAGRVQSVAVRLTVEREREVDAFTPASSFRAVGQFANDQGKPFSAELNKRFPAEEEALALVQACATASHQVTKLETKPAKRYSAPPFTTSTLQQEASRKLGYSVAQTMSLAQRLYEAGHITYMRTDSVNLSDEAMDGAQQAIVGNYGAEYHKPTRYKSKTSGAQEAHEAIRPTNFLKKAAGNNQEGRLYELIWKRAIASQMSPAELERTTAHISISGRDEHFVAKGEVVKFDGFLKVYIESTDDDHEDNEDQSTNDSKLLPALSQGMDVTLEQLTSREVFTRPPARYTEASLVKKLEEMGIGRPSTYAPTISTIIKREYVVKDSRDGKERPYRQLTLDKSKGADVKQETLTEMTGAEKAKLFPTNTGMVVNDFLVQHFGDIVDYNFTAHVEEQFDHISHGATAWQTMIDQFYGKFHPLVEKGEEIERSEAGSRLLGTDPKTGKNVYARIGRYGAMVQIGEAEDEEKPQFASMRTGQYIENITLEEALELFKLPRSLGDFEDEEVITNAGRFGPYVRHKGKFVSLKKEQDPMSITLEEAIALIEEKREADANRIIKTFADREDVELLHGRYGPYLKVGKQNVKLPKEIKDDVEAIKQLSLDECLKMAEDAPKKPARGGSRAGGKKAAKKK